MNSFSQPGFNSLLSDYRFIFLVLDEHSSFRRLQCLCCIYGISMMSPLFRAPSITGNPLLRLLSESKIRSFPSQMIDPDPFFVSFMNDHMI